MKKTILRNKHDDYKAFDDGLKEIMGNEDFAKATNPNELRAPDENDEEWAREIHHKLDVIEGKLDFLLKYLEL